MNADERFDQIVHDSLAWQATRVQATQPSLDVAVHKLAERLGPPRPVTRSAISLRPATSSAVSAILLILLFVALLGTAAFVGWQLLRELPPPRPGPFGFASECGVRLPEGVALEVYVGDGATTILSGGAVYTDLSSSVDSRVEAIRGTAFGQRQLTERGVALLIDRLTGAGVTSGCIALRSSDSQASITARTPSGYARLSWGSEAGTFSFARRMSPAEEEQALELLAFVSRPEESLPAEAWADSAVARIHPERWLVTIQFMETDLPRGAVVGLPNGQTLEGGDPRYNLVQLPDNQEPLTFGTEYRLDEPLYIRCGIVEASDALRLAESLDATFGSQTDWSLHTPDMAHQVLIDITPAFPPGHDCDAAMTARSGPPSQPSSPQSRESAQEEPCSLLPPVVMLEGRRWTDRQRSERSEIPLSRPARACWLLESADPLYNAQDESSAIFARRIALTLYPAKLAEGDARDIAETVLGYGTIEVEVANRPVWENDCLNAGKSCAPLAAFWHDGRLFFVQFHYANLTRPVLPLDEARAQVAAIIEALE